MSSATSDLQVSAIAIVTHTLPSRAVLRAYADPYHPDAVHNGTYVDVAVETVPGHDRHGKLKAWLYRPHPYGGASTDRRHRVRDTSHGGSPTSGAPEGCSRTSAR